MGFTITRNLLRRLTVAISAGVLALGLSGAASARGSGHGGNDYRGQHISAAAHHGHYGGKHHGYRKKHHRHGHRHRHRHYRARARGRGHRHHPRKVVHVYNHHDAPVEVVKVRRYHEPQAVVVQPAVEQDVHIPGPAAFDPRINAGSLMGAALGGLLGSQIGDGRGQLAATAAGTVGGFLLGDHVTRGYR